MTKQSKGSKASDLEAGLALAREREKHLIARKNKRTRRRNKERAEASKALKIAGEPTRLAILSKKLQVFLALYRERGAFHRCCRLSGMSVVSLQRLRAENPEVDEQIKQAEKMYVEKLEQEVDRRAFKGTRKDIYFEGQVVGSEKRYSDGLAQFRLKALDPNKYMDRSSQTVDSNTKVQIVMPDNSRPMKTIEG